MEKTNFYSFLEALLESRLLLIITGKAWSKQKEIERARGRRREKIEEKVSKCKKKN